MSKNTPIRVPYALSAHGKEESKAVARVIDEHRTNLGKEVRTFEARVAGLFGKKFGVMVNSGSSANLLAFEVLNLPQGSEVITPVLTFNTTVAPIIQKGLVPVFIDVKPGTFLIDIDQIEKKITSKTRVLMIPSLIGNIPDLERLSLIAKKYNLYLIEDSCDTIGATFNKKPTGAYSHISTTSFFGSHIINAGGGGGMIMVNDPDWHKRLLMLRGWGRSSSLFSESEDLDLRFASHLDGAPYDGKFLFTELGYNFLPMEIGAAFGLVQLKKLPRFTKMRQKNFKLLLDFFAKYPQFFDLPIQTERSFTNWLAFPLTIKSSSPFKRIDLVLALEKANIQTRPVFTGNILKQPVLSLKTPQMKGAHRENEVKLLKTMYTPLIAKVLRSLQRAQFPVADLVMKQSLLIGCHQSLGSQHIAHLKKTFTEFLKKYEQYSQ